jgi:hypothetical protein
MERGAFVPPANEITGRNGDRAQPAHDAEIVAGRREETSGFRNAWVRVAWPQRVNLVARGTESSALDRKGDQREGPVPSRVRRADCGRCQTLPQPGNRLACFTHAAKRASSSGSSPRMSR